MREGETDGYTVHVSDSSWRTWTTGGSHEVNSCSTLFQACLAHRVVFYVQSLCPFELLSYVPAPDCQCESVRLEFASVWCKPILDLGTSGSTVRSSAPHIICNCPMPVNCDPQLLQNQYLFRRHSHILLTSARLHVERVMDSDSETASNSTRFSSDRVHPMTLTSSGSGVVNSLPTAYKAQLPQYFHTYSACDELHHWPSFLRLSHDVLTIILELIPDKLELGALSLTCTYLHDLCKPYLFRTCSFALDRPVTLEIYPPSSVWPYIRYENCCSYRRTILHAHLLSLASPHQHQQRFAYEKQMPASGVHAQRKLGTGALAQGTSRVRPESRARTHLRWPDRGPLTARYA